MLFFSALPHKCLSIMTSSLYPLLIINGWRELDVKRQWKHLMKTIENVYALFFISHRERWDWEEIVYSKFYGILFQSLTEWDRRVIPLCIIIGNSEYRSLQFLLNITVGWIIILVWGMATFSVLYKNTNALYRYVFLMAKIKLLKI